MGETKVGEVAVHWVVLFAVGSEWSDFLFHLIQEATAQPAGWSQREAAVSLGGHYSARGGCPAWLTLTFGVTMNAVPYRLGRRLAVGASCSFLALLLYVPAEARATPFHDFYWHFVHPWGHALTAIFILGFCVAAVVIVAPVLRRGSYLQRLAGTIVVACPVLVLTRFLICKGVS
jgi:hypothetical protein